MGSSFLRSRPLTASHRLLANGFLFFNGSLQL
jgi:hypothetical protein